MEGVSLLHMDRVGIESKEGRKRTKSVGGKTIFGKIPKSLPIFKRTSEEPKFSKVL